MNSHFMTQTCKTLCTIILNSFVLRCASFSLTLCILSVQSVEWLFMNLEYKRFISKEKFCSFWVLFTRLGLSHHEWTSEANPKYLETVEIAGSLLFIYLLFIVLTTNQVFDNLLSPNMCYVWFQISRKSIYNWPNTLFCFSAAEVDVNSWISWNGERHVCMKCGGTFNRKDHAKRHVINQHIPQAEASCHVCHKTFKNAYYRDTHRSQEHGITKRMMEMKRYSISNRQMNM